MFLTQLAKLEEGTPDYYTPTAARGASPAASAAGASSPQLINFSKRRKIAAIIARIQTYQSGTYALREAAEVQSYLDARMGSWEAALLDDMRSASKPSAPCGKALDDAMNALSLRLEPRRGTTEAPSSRRGSVMPGAETSRPTTPRQYLPSPRRGSMPG